MITRETLDLENDMKDRKVIKTTFQLKEDLSIHMQVSVAYELLTS